jgi:hypothetical protein
MLLLYFNYYNISHKKFLFDWFLFHLLKEIYNLFRLMNNKIYKFVNKISKIIIIFITFSLTRLK